MVQGAPWVSALALRAIGAYVLLSRAVHALDFGSTPGAAVVLERPAPDAPAPADVWVRPRRVRLDGSAISGHPRAVVPRCDLRSGGILPS